MKQLAAGKPPKYRIRALKRRIAFEVRIRSFTMRTSSRRTPRAWLTIETRCGGWKKKSPGAAAMTYDQAYEIGKWIGGAILVVGFLWLAVKIGEYRTQLENEAGARREAIRKRKAAEKAASPTPTQTRHWWE